jgi:hypothetical protein
MLHTVEFLQIRDPDNFWNFVPFSGGLPSALYRVAEKSIDNTDNKIIERHLKNIAFYLLFEIFLQHGHLAKLGKINYILKILANCMKMQGLK